MMNERTNAGYRIIDSIHVGTKEFVLGVNEKIENMYVTWQCANGTDYFWGHYTDSREKAEKDLQARAAEERRYLASFQKNPGDVEDKNHLFMIVSHEGNSALIQFPTRELADILGSIGITAPPEQVTLRGTSYTVWLKHNIQDPVAAGIAALFTENNSLRMVNEVTRAVFNADYRVYDHVRDGLKENKYRNVEEVLRDATDMAKHLKDKKRGRER